MTDGKLVDEDAAWLRMLSQTLGSWVQKDRDRLERIATRLEQPSGMREALEVTHKLISEFALSGFTDHEVAARLFKNQGRIHAALSQQHKGDENA